MGAAVAARRLHLDLSRAELARRCHMRVADLRRIEQGRFVPSPSQAFGIAQQLQFDPEPYCAAMIRELFVHPEYLAEHVRAA